MIEVQPPSYGVTRQRELADPLDAHVEEIEVLGYTVVASGLDVGVLAQFRTLIDKAYGDQAAAGGNLDELGAESDILRCPLACDDLFLDAATLPSVLEIARRVLGDNLVLLQQNAIINQPQGRQYQSRWHRDLPYQHFVGSQALAVNALLCVDDFTLETGGTLVLPGSHMFEDFPSGRLVGRQELVVEATAGSVIMMHAMLYHRAGSNVSRAPRRGVNHLIGKPLLAQQIDIPRLLGPRHAEHPVLGPYLGYRWNPAEDVATWRDKRT
jgi:ectoine hydroxylase-related dioxygenase (phytanoyl-CoA dioxygenase family)